MKMDEDQAKFIKMLIEDAIETRKSIKVVYDELLKRCKHCKDHEDCKTCNVNELLNIIPKELLH